MAPHLSVALAFVRSTARSAALDIEEGHPMSMTHVHILPSDPGTCSPPGSLP